MATEINITYETLFELLRRERNRSELQELDDSFFNDVVNYLKEKNAIIEKTGANNLFSKNEKDRTLKQLENTKNILKDLYEKREKKIIEMALNKSRIQSNIDTDNLLKEEKEIFDNLVGVFDTYRNSILLNVLNVKLPEKIIEKVVSNKELIKNETEESIEVKKEKSLDVNQETKVVRFLHALPKFLGSELEVYGPFDQEDIANVPTRIADILILKKRAEEIKES